MKKTLTKEVYSLNGEKVGEIKLPGQIFDRALNTRVFSQTVVTLQKIARPQVAHSKGRAEVRGGGRKPWRQKGTGRARHGSIRSPIWRGGGVTHGPRSESKKYEAKINNRLKNQVLSMALSQKLRDKEIIIVEQFDITQPKTQILKRQLNTLIEGRKTNSKLLVVSKTNETLRRAASNLPDVRIVEARNVNVLDLLSNHLVIISKDAIAVLEKRFS